MDDYVCSEHQISAKGDASYEYHPVTEDDFPKLVKSTSEIQLTRARPTLVCKISFLPHSTTIDITALRYRIKLAKHCDLSLKSKT